MQRATVPLRCPPPTGPKSRGTKLCPAAPLVDIESASRADAPARFFFRGVRSPRRPTPGSPRPAPPARCPRSAPPRSSTPEISYPLLLRQVVHHLEHLVGGAHHARVRFIGALRQNHLDEFLHHVDVRKFQHALL